MSKWKDNFNQKWPTSASANERLILFEKKKEKILNDRQICEFSNKFICLHCRFNKISGILNAGINNQ